MEDLYKWYKQGFESLSPKSPSPHVWEAISAELNSSSKKKKRFLIWRIAGFVAILISMSGLIISHFNSSPPKSIVKKTPSETSNSTNLLSSNNYSQKKSTKKSLSIVQLQSNKTPQSNFGTSNQQKARLAPSHILQVGIRDPFYQAMLDSQQISKQGISNVPKIELLPINTTTSTNLLGISLEEIPNQIELQPINVNHETAQLSIQPKANDMGSNWFAGQNVEVNNNWLFNHDLKDATRKESINSIHPSFSMSHAFLLAKEIHPGNFIRAEFILAKSEGQHFQTYSEGIIQHKELELKYSGLTVLADKKSLNTQTFLGLPLKSHWLGGVSLCYLSGSKLAIGQVQNVLVGYRKMNVSLVAGYEKELMLSNHISFASGFRISGGLTNIFKGHDNIPAWFNRTHSGNIAWTFSLRYSFKAKTQ